MFNYIITAAAIIVIVGFLVMVDKVNKIEQKVVSHELMIAQLYAANDNLESAITMVQKGNIERETDYRQLVMDVLEKHAPELYHKLKRRQEMEEELARDITDAVWDFDQY